MDHFDMGRWADFVRGLGRQSVRANMEKHLASGCRECEPLVRMLRRVADVLRSDASCHVPEPILCRARAIYNSKMPAKAGLLPRLVARLRFDSFREPLPAGIRSRQHMARQVMFQAGDYSLDLRLEPQRGSAAIALVGQIADLRQPDKSIAPLTVFLHSGKELIARTTGNSFGEFQLEYQPGHGMRLCLQIGNDRQERIEVPLVRISRDGSVQKRTAKRPRE